MPVVVCAGVGGVAGFMGVLLHCQRASLHSGQWQFDTDVTWSMWFTKQKALEIHVASTVVTGVHHGNVGRVTFLFR